MTLSHHDVASALDIVGLVCVFAGSIVTALAVILTEDAAIHIAGQIGASPYGPVIPSRKEFLQQPAVHNLIRQSKMANWGLLLIAGGTLIQIIGVLTDVKAR